MAHIIETLSGLSIEESISILANAHAQIVDTVLTAEATASNHKISWGINFKRQEVLLPVIPGIIGKPSEKLVEIINILATTERTISALKWFSHEYPDSIVRECDASTSDNAEGNDITLINNAGEILLSCEVCDVASSNAAQNGKEKNDIKILGCSGRVPNDGVRRFIATSSEFAAALTSQKRKWQIMNYRYIAHATGYPDQTVLLEIVEPKDN